MTLLRDRGVGPHCVTANEIHAPGMDGAFLFIGGVGFVQVKPCAYLRLKVPTLIFLQHEPDGANRTLSGAV